MTFEYVATGKPIYFTVKHNGYVTPKDSIAECWYWIRNPNEVEQYLDMFAKGEDPMALKRLKDQKSILER